MAKGQKACSWNVGMSNLGVNARCFLARYSPKNIDSPFTRRMRLTKPIMDPKFDHMLETREKDIIWTSISLGSPADTASVARSFYARQFKSAFCEALESRGYDKDGRRLVLDSEGKVIGKSKPGLSCTIQIILNPPIKHAEREELVKEAGVLVQELERLQEKPWLLHEGRQAAKLRNTRKT
ncbi:uncharacterized protein GIQ15_00928 [Arthroderma uncinatum]|uniref:uncharacterized protein n=1 Tax=Arthroderma uncinatum TaxID=74035 RepID=UPI00144AF0E2|nr:uncharacterized protein GIQ15_00928 [Arthroderma uncinatum]KAF3491411.1 hypothetical protein GIQ15_00928 [Arthroderma uncinatum]